MRCMNCGLPLSPARNLSNCPRCGAALEVAQGIGQQPGNQVDWENQAGWGSMEQPQNPWGQEAFPNSYQQSFNQQPFNQQVQFGSGFGQMNEAQGAMGSGLPQTPMSPRRPLGSQNTPKKPGAGLKVALAGLILATLLLAIIAIMGFSGLGKSSPNTARTNPTATASTSQATPSPTATDASASPTADASATASGTPYPGQQYIDGAQMAQGVTNGQPQQPTTTFTVGSKMYVAFNLHPPSTGGEVCIYWYLNSNQIGDPVTIGVPPGSHSSHAWASYNNAGPAYVELYWASDKTCSDKVLAQHVDFTVTT